MHGTNRLGGSSLLDCVVYGRIAGRSSTKFLLDKLLRSPGAAQGGSAAGLKGPGGVSATVRFQGNNKVTLELSLAEIIADAVNEQEAVGGAGGKSAGIAETDPNAAFYGQGVAKPGAAAAAAPAAGAAAAPAAAAGKGGKAFPMDEVKKHTKDTDCWVVIRDQVYDVTKFLNDHPGGKKAIMLYAGKDATTEFEMLHSKELLARYGPEFHIGALQGASKL